MFMFVSIRYFEFYHICIILEFVLLRKTDPILNLRLYPYLYKSVIVYSYSSSIFLYFTYTKYINTKFTNKIILIQNI